MSNKKGQYSSVKQKADNGWQIRPDEKSFGQSLYDSKEGLILGRTPLSWFKVIVFFTIYYSCLCAFFAVNMHFFMLTIDEKVPSRILEDSIIGVNPGLGFFPKPPVDEGALIWYASSNRSAARMWANRIDEDLDGYFDSKKLPNKGKDQVVCSFDQPPKQGKACAVPIENWTPCTKEDGYSYERASPCILLKMNRIYGWVPEVYNDTDDLPEEMPEDLKDTIRKLPENQRNQVWMHCHGENPADRENIGPIQYVSTRGFPAYYFPFTNVADYLSPLVAIRLERPRPHVIINVECRVWAKNVKYHGGRERLGSVHFEVMID